MNAVDKYIGQFPEAIQVILTQVRNVILHSGVEISEEISYSMPAYKAGGKVLVYFAGYKNHIGFYATPTGHSQFNKELSKFKQGKGSVQFPIDKPMPLDLIKRIVQFRVEEVREKLSKAKEKTCSKGHKFFKTSDCPTCPVCENLRKPIDSFMSLLAAPARRALENAGITTLKQLSRYSEKEIMALHGIGKSSIPRLNDALKLHGLKFKSQ